MSEQLAPAWPHAPSTEPRIAERRHGVLPLTTLQILEKLGQGETLPQHELAYLTGLLIEREVTKRQATPYATDEVHENGPPVTVVSDATTGNALALVFSTPKGYEAHVNDVCVTAPGSAIIPPAGLANAAIYTYLAVLPKGHLPLIVAANAAAPAITQGIVAFAPNPPSVAATPGAALPAQWTFTDATAPIMRDEQMLVFGMIGGSVAAAKTLQLSIAWRVNRFRRAVS
ncbi:MAG: hypothetical protein ACRD2H_13865 [Terriglobales bacterium]